MISAVAFFQTVEQVLAKLRETQLVAIERAAFVLAECVENDGVVHVFGTGHSKAFAMEMCHRAGGIVPMHMMSLDDLFLRGLRPIDDLQDPSLERDPAIAHQLLACYDIEPRDAAVVVSNSGRNGVIVEMALALKQKGLPVVCVTSLAHSQAVSSRHLSGKRLFEVADCVIDNCGPMGDAILTDERLSTKACSVSSVTGAVIAQCLTAEVIRILLRRGESIPVYMSANLDGADEWNENIRARYQGRI
ncbi:sugar isomerase domain-containing protein [Alicyclobacillus shizuokensis]|uniref:sugar isomerase domain-containing protein n=1 Tax=Alicyclobacillus shizuokensis TaxID=392014 RepID=UPI0009F8B5C7|nr:SIS domain-containing protein [Alicyclobacillus shizuokensis]